jgi:hypothetical protein
MKFSQFLKEESYKEFFAKKLKKYGVNSPSELSDADKKKFYDEVDAEWEDEDEELEEAIKIGDTISYIDRKGKKSSGTIAKKSSNSPKGYFLDDGTFVSKQSVIGESEELDEASRNLGYMQGRGSSKYSSKDYDGEWNGKSIHMNHPRWDSEGSKKRADQYNVKLIPSDIDGKSVEVIGNKNNVKKYAISQGWNKSDLENDYLLESIELEEKMKDKPYEKQIGMGDSRSEKELRDQISGLSDDTLKKWASKPAGMLGSKAAKLQDKLVAAEMKKRGLKEAVELEQTFKRGDEVIIKYRDSGTGKVLKTNKDGTIKVKWRQTQIATDIHPSKLTNLDA